MKLLVITMLYEPDRVGIAAIATDLCHALSERGHQVTVYTTYPYYPEWKRKCDGKAWRIGRETIAGISVRRHGLYIPKHPSRLFPRLLHELSFPLSLLRSTFSRERYDAVMVFCPLLGSVAFAAMRKIFRRRELVWLNVQDVPVEAGTATGINRSRLFQRIASRVQRRLFKAGNVWSSISPEMVSHLAQDKGDDVPPYLCPNWLVASLERHVSRQPSKLGRQPGSPIKMLYCGTIGKKQDLLRFCQALAQSDLDFVLQIRGAGSEAGRLQSWMESQKDPRFLFGPLISDADFVQSIHNADWFVITEMHGAGSSFLPSKLIPCIAVGTPVLSLCDHQGPLGREVTTHRLGLSLAWSDLEELPQRLDEIQQDLDGFTQLQQNCIDRAVDFQRELSIDRIESLLKRSVAEHCQKVRPVRRSETTAKVETPEVVSATKPK